MNNDFIYAPLSTKFDAIVFTTPYGYVKRYGRNIRLEREYINKSLDVLNNDGLMIVTVPCNVLTAPLWQETRRRIINDYSLEMVIYCGGIFQNSGVNWYTLVIKNNKQRESIYFANFSNNSQEIVDNYQCETGDFWVNKNEFKNRWDRTYLDPKYDSLRKMIYNKKTTRLGDIAEIIRGIP